MSFLLTYVRVALGRSVKLSHLRNVETIHEFLPNLCAQPVAIHDSDLVILVGRRWTGRQHVTAHFANVLCRCARILSTVRKVLGRRKLLPQHNRAASDQGLTHGHATTRRVVKWERSVEYVVRSELAQNCKGAGRK
jgi:hypothetical protein